MCHSFAFEHLQNECKIYPIYHILCQCLCGPLTSWHISSQCNFWPIAYLSLFMYKGEGSIELTCILFTFSFSSSICDEMSKSYHYFCWAETVVVILACHVLCIRRVGAYHHGKGCRQGCNTDFVKKWHIITMGATQILLKNGTLTILFEKFNSAI